MSSIQANNPPESESDSQSSSADRDEPEPSACDADERPRSRTSQVDDSTEIVVDLLWDDSVNDYEASLSLAKDQIVRAVNEAARLRGYRRGQIGIRITDDESIHLINVRHLSHDYPTDVISFPYSEDPNRIEGELVASVETAESNSEHAGWDTNTELLLYIIHGVLHIGGMDDAKDEDRAEMRLAEAAVMQRLGIAGEELPDG